MLPHRCELSGLLTEIGLGCVFDAYGAMEEVEIVKIQGDDLFLGVHAFELDGRHPFDRLL